MIIHKHIRVDAPAGPLAGFLQSFQKAFAILDIGKDPLPPATASHDMVNRSRILNAQRPCHWADIAAN